MQHKRYGRWTLRTDWDLPELLASTSDDADYTVHLHEPRREKPPARWTYVVRDRHGRIELRVARVGHTYLLDYPKQARYLLDPLNRTIDVHPRYADDHAQTRHIFLDHVMPRVLGLAGHAVLHGTCVRTPNGSAAFLGETGYGKSTLAISLARAGHPLQADDCLIVEEGAGQHHVIPSYGGSRLWADSASALLDGYNGDPTVKHLLNPGAEGVTYDPEPSPLRALYLLGNPANAPANGVGIQPVPARKAFLRLLNQGFHLDARGAETNVRLFFAFTGLANAVPAYRLDYRREHDYLPHVHQAILDHVAQLARGEHAADDDVARADTVHGAELAH